MTTWKNGMANVFNSGAFLQQCFSVHPLSLRFKMFAMPDKIGIVCLHCKSRHRLTIGAITRVIGDSELREDGAATGLGTCATTHQEALHVTEVSVDRDIVQFRCRECKAGFQATICLFETHQP